MDEKINQPSTPLRAIGEEGKAAVIVDFQESYSAVEGLRYCFRFPLLLANATWNTISLYRLSLDRSALQMQQKKEGQIPTRLILHRSNGLHLGAGRG